MGSWNFADIWETVADELPDAPCLVHGDNRRTWAQVDKRADGIAQHLLDVGLERQQAVAQYLYNSAEYLESMYAAFKAALVPVNTNYRYTSDELLYLWDNADAGAVVFHGTFAGNIEPIREKLPKVSSWLWVDDGSGDCPDWATPYETVAGQPTDRVAPAWGRSGDDLNMLYTGGTTGMPKGVMWRQDDLVVRLGTLGKEFPDDGSVADLTGSYTEPGGTFLPACPQMHGTGNFPCLAILAAGGSVVTLPNRSFDPAEMLDVIAREGVNMTSIVGDAFAKPILRALDDAPGRWDLSSLLAIVSSGVMWSRETKQRLLDHHPTMMLMDAFSSSEALGIGQSLSGAGVTTAETAKFELSEDAIVIDDEDRPIQPGSDQIGRLAVGGRQPLGYYKDPDKTARTFLTIDGQRYSCPGDFATVAADGTITLLGRGSVCINTGGEKVFPEEVEEALKTHPSVVDAVAVGVPDEKFGEAVTGVVEASPGADIDPDDLIAHVKQRLAGYKAPKRVVTIDTIGRAANGKVDYRRLRTHAVQALGIS